MIKFNEKNLNMFSLFLCLVIVILLIFGCSYKRVEHFNNTKKKNIEEFQNSIIEGVMNGKIDKKKITEYIKENKLSKQDLNGIIETIALSNTKM